MNPNSESSERARTPPAIERAPKDSRPQRVRVRKVRPPDGNHWLLGPVIVGGVYEAGADQVEALVAAGEFELVD